MDLRRIVWGGAAGAGGLHMVCTWRHGAWPAWWLVHGLHSCMVADLSNLSEEMLAEAPAHTRGTMSVHGICFSCGA